MNYQAVALAQETDDRITRYRVAAFGKLQCHALRAADNQAAGQLLVLVPFGFGDRQQLAHDDNRQLLAEPDIRQHLLPRLSAVFL